MTQKQHGFRGEFVLGRASVKSVWNQITTSRGLSSWFASRVIIKGEQVKVYWDEEGDHRFATVIQKIPHELLQWQWNDNTSAYISMAVIKTELTSTVSLLVEDNDPDLDYDTLLSLWDSHIDSLKRSLGL